MADKTNASRILDRLKIPYTLYEYEVDPEHLDVAHVAESINQPIDQLYKTLVLRGDKTGIFVGVIAGNKEIDLKKAAKASGNKKAEMIHLKELQPLTGYIRGGCTAIGMKKNYPVFLDNAALQNDSIFVSAGRRGLQIYLKVEDYLKATGATVADLGVVTSNIQSQD